MYIRDWISHEIGAYDSALCPPSKAISNIIDNCEEMIFALNHIFIVFILLNSIFHIFFDDGLTTKILLIEKSYIMKIQAKIESF